MELSVPSIAVSLQQLTGQLASISAAPLPPKTQTSCPPPALEPALLPKPSAPPGLLTKACNSRAVANSARLAGVPGHQVSGDAELGDAGAEEAWRCIPQDKQKVTGRNVLSETEDEEELVPDSSDSGLWRPCWAVLV